MTFGSKRESHGKRWDELSDADLIHRVGQGQLLRQIATEMGRTQEAVRSRANILKLPVRSSPTRARVGFHGEGAPAEANGSRVPAEA